MSKLEESFHQLVSLTSIWSELDLIRLSLFSILVIFRVHLNVSLGTY